MKKLLLLFLLIFSTSALATTDISFPTVIKCGDPAKGEKSCYNGARFGMFTISMRSIYPGQEWEYLLPDEYSFDEFSRIWVFNTIHDHNKVAPQVVCALYRKPFWGYRNFELCTDIGWYADPQSNNSWVIYNPKPNTYFCNSANPTNCPLKYIAPDVD